MWQPPIRNARILAPLVALLAFALLAIVLAAQAGLAFCTERVAVSLPMDAMPGMAPGHALMICPVVLVLIVACIALATAAIVAGWSDADRGTTQRILARLIARLPVGRALLVVGGGSALAIAAMLAVDGAGLPSVATCGLLFALLFGGTLISVIAAVLGARVVLALGVRLLIALVAAIADRCAARRPAGWRWAPPRAGSSPLSLLSTGLGLRAPPSFVR